MICLFVRAAQIHSTIEFISSEAAPHAMLAPPSGWMDHSQLLHWDHTTVADPLVNGANEASGGRVVREAHMHRNVLPCIVSATSGSTLIGANTVA